jgi:hypothetical protein
MSCISFLGEVNRWSLDCSKKNFRFLQGRKSYAIRLNPIHGTSVVPIAAPAGDIVDRKSSPGFVFQMGCEPISWGSKKQTRVAHTCLSFTSCQKIKQNILH